MVWRIEKGEKNGMEWNEENDFPKRGVNNHLVV